MNHCYYCSKPVNRSPFDQNHAYVCDTCKARFQERKARGQNPLTGQPEQQKSVADFWTKDTK